MEEAANPKGEEAFLRDLMRAAAASPASWNHLAEEAVRHLIRVGIHSREGLILRLPTLEGEALLAGIRATSLLKLRRAGMALVFLIASPDSTVRGMAQAAFSDVRPRRAFRPLARLARTHSDCNVAVSAAHALAFTFDAAATPYLLELFDAEDLPPRVRAQAAEGLGNTLGWSDRRRKLFRRAANSLIEELRADSPELRFWCCFALGQMRARRAIPELRRLAETDPDFCPGWWHIRDEAADALQWTDGGTTPSRNMLGWTATAPRVPAGYDEEGRNLNP